MTDLFGGRIAIQFNREGLVRIYIAPIPEGAALGVDLSSDDETLAEVKRTAVVCFTIPALAAIEISSQISAAALKSMKLDAVLDQVKAWGAQLQARITGSNPGSEGGSQNGSGGYLQ